MEITVLTFNLDGSEWCQEERLNRFIDRIKGVLPDVVFVQEATRLTTEKLLREMGYLKYKRFLSNAEQNPETREIVFSKFPLSDTSYIPFQITPERRGLSVAKMTLEEGKYLWICTSQFESSYSYSRKQILGLSKSLRNIPVDETIIFGGDTRILEYYDHNQPEGWEDAWYEAGTERQQYTVNSHTNQLTSPPLKDRPDRVWFRQGLCEEKLVCRDCKFFGESEPFSSHFGVLVTFELS